MNDIPDLARIKKKPAFTIQSQDLASSQCSEQVMNIRHEKQPWFDFLWIVYGLQRNIWQLIDDRKCQKNTDWGPGPFEM